MAATPSAALGRTTTNWPGALHSTDSEVFWPDCQATCVYSFQHPTKRLETLHKVFDSIKHIAHQAFYDPVCDLRRLHKSKHFSTKLPGLACTIPQETSFTGHLDFRRNDLSLHQPCQVSCTGTKSIMYDRQFVLIRVALSPTCNLLGSQECAFKAKVIL